MGVRKQLAGHHCNDQRAMLDHAACARLAITRAPAPNASLSPPPPPPPKVRFFQVSEDELESVRERFAAGQYDVNIEPKTFSIPDYVAMVSGAASSWGGRRGVGEGAAEWRNACQRGINDGQREERGPLVVVVANVGLRRQDRLSLAGCR